MGKHLRNVFSMHRLDLPANFGSRITWALQRDAQPIIASMCRGQLSQVGKFCY